MSGSPRVLPWVGRILNGPIPLENYVQLRIPVHDSKGNVVDTRIAYASLQRIASSVLQSVASGSTGNNAGGNNDSNNTSDTGAVLASTNW